MSKNNLTFGVFKISQRKRTGKNIRTIFYLTPSDEKQANIEDYSQKYLIAIRRGFLIERYPECFPNSLSDDQKLQIIEYLKTRENTSPETPSIQQNTADFDVFENILE